MFSLQRDGTLGTRGLGACEARRTKKAPETTRTTSTIGGGVDLIIGLIVAIGLGAQPGPIFGLAAVVVPSYLPREHWRRLDTPEPDAAAPPRAGGRNGSTRSVVAVR